MISVPNLRLFWCYSLNKPPFRVRSGEAFLNCPEYIPETCVHRISGRCNWGRGGRPCQHVGCSENYGPILVTDYVTVPNS